MDYLRVIGLTLKDFYTLPCIDDSITTMQVLKWASTSNLASGYYEVPMHPTDIDKMALKTNLGLYHFTGYKTIPRPVVEEVTEDYSSSWREV